MTSSADDGAAGTLRYAVTHSLAGDTIVFNSAAFASGTSHTILLTAGELEIAHDLTIQGPGPATLAINGNNTNRVFQVDANVTVSLSGMMITGGNAASGGGGAVFNNGGTLSLTNASVTGNAAGLGGGVYTAQGNTTAGNCTFSSNSATVSGGGFDCDSGTSAVLAGCTFNNNTSPVGGGILNSGNTLTLVNSTLTANTATGGEGGGISNASGSLTVTNCTLAGNASTQPGGGIAVGAGSVTLNNTMVTGNTQGTASPNSPSDIAGTVSGAFNLISDGSGGFSPANGNLLGTTASPLSPGLLPLANNGGPTQTMALQSTSPAINAGSDALVPPGLISDQRGFARIADGPGVDIGAYEFAAAPLALAASPTVPLTVNSPQDGVDYTPGRLTLRQAIDLANGVAGAHTVNFNAAALGSGAQTITLTQGPLEISNSSGSVTINGPGAALLQIRGSQKRLFTIDSGSVVAISSIALSPGQVLNQNGGGIYNQGTLSLNQVAISNSTLVQSNASQPAPNGGGIYNAGGTLNITNSTFTANGAATGAAIYADGGSVSISDSTISANNASDGNGAAIFVAGTLTAANSTVYGNTGEGVYAAGGGVLTNCTIAANTFAGLQAGSNFVLNNTIVAMNGGATPHDIIAQDPQWVTGSCNFVGTGGAASLMNGISGNIVGAAAGLAPLANYGGPTQTVALMAGSPAMNAGSNALAADAGGTPLTTDQRGMPRVFGASVDIGAFESQPSALAGDVNHDGTVNLTDLLTLTRNFGKITPVYELGDADGNGTVGLADFLSLTRNYGRSAPSLAAIASVYATAPAASWRTADLRLAGRRR